MNLTVCISREGHVQFNRDDGVQHTRLLQKLLDMWPNAQVSTALAHQLALLRNQMDIRGQRTEFAFGIAV